MKNIMLDLETMSTSSNAAIVSIGAVEFDEDLGIVSKFYETIDLESCMSRGFDIEPQTIMWWLKQSDYARESLFKNNISIADALRKFQEWIGKDNLRMWGNGSDFDNVILENAFKRFKVNSPWPYWSNRCFRTIKYSFPSLEQSVSKKDKIKHNSLDDAEAQANYLIKICDKYKLKGVI